MIHPIVGFNTGTANDTNDSAENRPLERVARALVSARAPVFLVGRGVAASRAESSLVRLAELLPHVAFASTPSAKGTFPEVHAQAVGVFGFGGHDSARAALVRADVLFILGSQLLEQSSDGWSEALNAALVFRFDFNASRLVAQWPLQQPIDGDLAMTLKSLVEAVELQPRPPELLANPRLPLMSEFPQYTGAPSADRHVKPQTLFASLNRIAPDVPLCADAGNSMCWAIEWLQRRKPNTFYVSLDWGSMGFAMPAALGVSLARSTHVVAVTGDGSMAMAGGELHTAAEYSLPVIVIVLNDRAAGMVRMGMDLWFGEHASVPGLTYRHCMNFAEFARSLGVHGKCVTCLESFELELTRALSHPGPTLLDVHVDPTEVPNALSSRVKGLLTQATPVAGGGLC